MSIGVDELNQAEIPISRSAAIQPPLTLGDLSEGVLHNEDPVFLQGLTNLLRAWASLHPDLPARFAEGVKVVEACRQPICWVTAESQEVRRSFVDVIEPYPGGTVNSRPFATQDPFQLGPPSPTDFPAQPVSLRFPVVGQESVAECTSCDSAGATTCNTCHGEGTILCRECGGARSVTCSRCQGAGSHQGVSGDMIQCQLCRTRGTVRCPSCTSGRVPCDGCGGAGEITCHVCQGHRNLKRRWEVASYTSTVTRRRPFMHEPWNLPLERLLTEGDELACRTWEWPEPKLADHPLDVALPVEVVSLTKDLLRQSLSGVSLAASSERVTGIRVRVSATYVYRLTIDHDGTTGALLLAGARNFVFVENLPTARIGWFGKILESTQRMLSLVDMADRIGPPPELVESIRAGAVHISDSLCLVSRAAAMCRAEYQVTMEGYRVTIAFSASATPPVTFDISLELDRYGQWITRTSCRLGIAHRDQAPNALTMNGALSFGRLAITSREGEATEYFDLFDIRPYQQTSVVHFSQIMRSLALDVVAIRKRKLLA